VSAWDSLESPEGPVAGQAVPLLRAEPRRWVVELEWVLRVEWASLLAEGLVANAADLPFSPERWSKAPTPPALPSKTPDRISS